MSEIYLIFVKDIKSFLRARSQIIGAIVFALLLVLVSSFAFKQIASSQFDLKNITAGILWLVFLFSGVLVLNYSFSFEGENGALKGILMTPVDPMSIYIAKYLSCFSFIFTLQLFVVLIHSLFFGVEISGSFPLLIFLVFLGSIGFSSLGTLFAAISSVSPSKDILLPIILFPLLLPFIAALVSVTKEMLISGVLDLMAYEFVFICVFDVVSLVLASVLFEFVIQD